MTGTFSKPVPVQQLKTIYDKYGTRNNKVKSLMRATRNRVHMPSPHACVVRHRYSCSGIPQDNGQQKSPGGCLPGPHVYCCVLLVSGFPECYGLSLMVMTTVTFRAAGRDPFGSRPSTGTIAVRTSPTLWMVTVDAPSEKLSLIHISEPTRLGMISYAVFCLKKKKKT